MPRSRAYPGKNYFMFTDAVFVTDGRMKLIAKIFVLFLLCVSFGTFFNPTNELQVAEGNKGAAVFS